MQNPAAAISPVALLIVLIAALLGYIVVKKRLSKLHHENQHLTNEVQRLTQLSILPVPAQEAPPEAIIVSKPYIKTPEERKAERKAHRMKHLHQQLDNVQLASVTFKKKRVMTGRELDLFYIARDLANQSAPHGDYPFYVFPQVNLGEIFTTEGAKEWEKTQAFLAFNSKRGDLLIANRGGFPVAVIEYQGEAHYLGEDASIRDKIKRIALKRASISLVEVAAGTPHDEMKAIIKELFIAETANQAAKQ